jgi:hypothetical protein
LQDLGKKIFEKHFIYIRSPSATGKTSIAHLIERSEEWKEKYDIIYFDFKYSSPEEVIKSFQIRTGYTSFLDALDRYKGEKHLLFILDDAQNLFTKNEDEKTLLDGLKPLDTRYVNMPLEKKKVHILILATHGESTLGSRQSRITFKDPDQILGIDYLFFSKTEYDAAIINLQQKTELPLADLPLSFFKITNGKFILIY